MALSVAEKSLIVGQFAQHTQDTGSVEVQVALLTHDIAKINDHLKMHSKDVHCRRGLMNKVGQRRALLDYIKRTEPARYRNIISALGLRK